MLSDLQTNQISLLVLTAAALIAVYLFFTAWVIERAHKWRMRLAELGTQFISQDSQISPEEQRLVAWMLGKAYSSRPMLELMLAYPAAVWSLFRKSPPSPHVAQHPYDRLRARAGGEEFARLFALSIMAANVPVTIFYVVLTGILSPFLTMRGGTDGATERAVDRMVSSHEKDNDMIAA